MARLAESLHSTDGEARFRIEFGRDPIGIDFAKLEIDATLEMICQRTLRPFPYQVKRTVRLGLISSEDEIASLPEGYEPLLVPDQPVRLTDLVEDELILDLPLVPMSEHPVIGEDLEPSIAADDGESDEQLSANPFAILAGLKGQSDGNGAD
jgi:uncharacterized protein